MTKFYLISKNMRVNKFPDIFFLVVPRKTFILKLGPNFSHFFMHDLNLLIFGLAPPDLSDEKGQSSDSMRLLIVRVTHI